MNENRNRILEILAAGKITADEAERLLAALETAAPSAGASASASKAKAKYMRVVVESEEGSHQGPVKVNTRVPMKLLRAGVRLASRIPVQAGDHVNDAQREKGIGVDLHQIRPENLDEIVAALEDVSVDAEHQESDQKVKVRVFCE